MNKEEIAQFVLALTERLYKAYGTDTEYLFGLLPSKRNVVKAIIDNAVVWTLAAITEGKLKLPGEEGRAYTNDDITQMDLVSIFTDYGEWELIAVRREEGDRD